MVEVVVPLRRGNPERDAAWRHLRDFWPWPVIECDSDGHWSKPRAVMQGVESSAADILVVADADVWTGGIQRAIRQVEAGAPWAVPHLIVRRLSPGGTVAVLGGAPLDSDLDLTEPPRAGVWGGGIVVLPRETALEVPLDPRFVGWGQEDLSWAMALHTMKGRGWRGDDTLFHLWHTPQARVNRAWGNTAGLALWRRYLAARLKPDKMRALLDEAKESY